MIQDTQNAQISLTHNGSKIYIYICNYENNVPSRFSQQRLCRNSYPCTCVVWIYIYKIHALSLSLKTIFFSDIFQNAQISLTHNLFQKVKCLPTLSKSRKRVIGVSLRAFS